MEERVIECSTYNMNIGYQQYEHTYSFYEDSEKTWEQQVAETQQGLLATCCFDHACFTMILLYVRNEVM